MKIEEIQISWAENTGILGCSDSTARAIMSKLRDTKVLKVLWEKEKKSMA